MTEKEKNRWRKSKEFEEVLRDCDKKYKNKLSEYGESWKEMLPAELVKRVFFEMEELATAKGTKEAYEETIDVINCSLMLASKFKKELKNT